MVDQCDPLCNPDDEYESFIASDGHISLRRRCDCDIIKKADQRGYDRALSLRFTEFREATKYLCPNCGSMAAAHYCMGPPAVDKYCQCVCHESLSRMDPHRNEKCRCNGGTGYDAL